MEPVRPIRIIFGGVGGRGGEVVGVVGEVVGCCGVGVLGWG